MGLALADHIARAHGGICRISSEHQIGVKQCIYLPIVGIDEKT
jgi:nitrogen-specific signal transduction histidine kinase